MDDILELLVEFLLDIAIDGGVEAISSKKTPRWGRLILAIVVGLLCFAIIIGVIIFGIMTLDESVMGGAFIIVVGVGLFIAAIKYFVIGLIIKLIQKSSEVNK